MNQSNAALTFPVVVRIAPINVAMFSITLPTTPAQVENSSLELEITLTALFHQAMYNAV